MKRILPVFFSHFQKEKIEEYLTRKAMEGWLPEKINGIFWTFRPAQPQDLNFCAVYDPKYSPYDPDHTEAQLAYREYAEETGWEYVCGDQELQIFRTGDPDAIPPETDPALALAAMEKILERRLLPGILLFLVTGLSGFLPLAVYFRFFPIEVLSSPTRLGLLLLSLGILLLGPVSWIIYLILREKARRKAAVGEFPRFGRFVGVLQALGLLLYAAEAAILLSGRRGLTGLLAAMLILYQALRFILRQITRFLRTRKVPAGKNKRITMICSLAAAVLYVSTVTVSLNWAKDVGLLEKAQDESPHSQPVLTLADLTGEDPGGCAEQYDRNDSPLLGLRWGNQRLRQDGDTAEEPSLEYRIVYVKVPLLYGLCENELLETRHIGSVHYMPIDSRPWGARAAYRLTGTFRSGSMYLLCYADRIVELSLSWTPTAEQIAVAAEKLAE